MTAGTTATMRSVWSLADEAHGRIAERLRQVEVLSAGEALDDFLYRVGEGSGGIHQNLLSAYDAVLSELSRHLLGIEVAVLPVARQLLADGRSRVHAHVRRACRLEATVRAIEQLLYGDARAPSHRLDLLHAELRAQMSAHRQEEERMLRALDDALDLEARAVLASRLELATRRAPTRPHPYASRRLWWSRALYRPAGAWDRLLDVLDSRNVPALVLRPRRRPGLWGSYLLGQPLPPENEQPSRPPARVE